MDSMLQQDPAAPPQVPSTEVVLRAKRRRFTKAYKRCIVSEADACQVPGEVGALLRREGLYSSQLSKWRQQLDSPETGTQSADKVHALRKELRAVRKTLARTRREPKPARQVIEVQEKISRLLGLETPDEPGQPSILCWRNSPRPWMWLPRIATGRSPVAPGTDGCIQGQGSGKRADSPSVTRGAHRFWHCCVHSGSWICRPGRYGPRCWMKAPMCVTGARCIVF